MNVCIKSLSPEHVMNAITGLDNELAARLMACVDIVAYAEKLAINASFVVAESEDISGLIAFYINDREDSLFVPYVCVDKMYRGTGLADRMMAALCAKADELCYSISLEVRNDNLRAMRLYERYGFVKEADCVEKCRMVRYSVKAEPYPIMVTVVCCTYNQENYISQCLDGFVAQKTNFPFEVIVHDDASTDGTAAIVKEYAEKYPDIIKPIYQTDNLYSKKNGELSRVTMAASRGKYIAICEGDDWWTDPNKLQRQVDYMEAHPECPMCFTAQGTYLQETDEILDDVCDSVQYYSERDMIRANWVGTLTSMLRASIMREYKTQILPHLPYFPLGDWPMWLYFSKVGKLVKLPESTGVYRVLPHSASHMSDTFKQLRFVIETYRMREYFNKLLGINKPNMRFRTYRDALRFSKRYASVRKEPFFPLLFQSLKYVIRNPAPVPSKELRARVAELLEKYPKR